MKVYSISLPECGLGFGLDEGRHMELEKGVYQYDSLKLVDGKFVEPLKIQFYCFICLKPIDLSCLYGVNAEYRFEHLSREPSDEDLQELAKHPYPEERDKVAAKYLEVDLYVHKECDEKVVLSHTPKKVRECIEWGVQHWGEMSEAEQKEFLRKDNVERRVYQNVLTAIYLSRHNAGVREIAAATGLARSSVSRLMKLVESMSQK